MSAPIESYAIVGDCRTVAVVGLDGSIDWLCWPRFDSDACFAALLGTPANGRWLIRPMDPAAVVSRRYRKDTLILETSFLTGSGKATLIDFMVPRGDGPHLVRLVRGDEGEVELHMQLVLRFGYGATIPWVTRGKDQSLRAVAGPDMTVLRTPVALQGQEFTTSAVFTVTPEAVVPFVLSYGPSHLPEPPAIDALQALDSCEAFWREWSAQATVFPPYDEAVRRSLITLKALTYEPSGGIVAAPTASLPESIGGMRNWDYRYCWIRDSTFTLLALMDAGLYEEAAAWRDWLLRAAAGAPGNMQIMYGVMGERRLTEWQADWLPGYLDSRPVRFGNSAHRQFQLDVYSELMDSFDQARAGGLAATESGWALQLAVVRHVARRWHEPDYGIWESRGPRRHFVFSKVMAWVTLDRAIRAVERYGLPGDVLEWRCIRDAIHDEVCARGFDACANTFRAAYDSTTLDASLLLLAQVGFLDGADPRFGGTVAAVERELLVDGFVMRYDTGREPDGLQPGEGAFLACSFWLADAYPALGRRTEAQALFERLLTLTNDVGLLAEEFDVRRRRQVGNFPQAFSHVALINTASTSRGRCIRPSSGPARKVLCCLPAERAAADRERKRARARRCREPGRPSAVGHWLGHRRGDLRSGLLCAAGPAVPRPGKGLRGMFGFGGHLRSASDCVSGPTRANVATAAFSSTFATLRMRCSGAREVLQVVVKDRSRWRKPISPGICDASSPSTSIR